MTEPSVNHFIDEAFRLAQERVNKLGKTHDKLPGVKYKNGRVSYYRHSYLTQFFHQEMNRLTAEAGIRVL